MNKIIILSLGLFFLMAGIVFAASYPAWPEAYYGTVGNASAGTVITAKISSTSVGSITMTSDGVYGGASPSSEKLLVCAAGVCTSGATITFSASTGSISPTTHTFTPGAITELNFDYTPSAAEVTTTSTSVGGGGSGVTAEPSAAEATESKMWGSVEAGKENVMIIDNELIPLTEFSFVTDKDITNVEITVNSYTEKPSAFEAVPLSESSLVYKYIEIVPENIEEGDLTKSEIEFKVPLSWLDENNAEAEDIILLGFEDGEWVEISAGLISKDSVNAYYKVENPGFGSFSVGLKPKAAEKEPVEEAEEEEVPEEEIAPEVKEKKVPIGWIIAAAIVVIGLIIYFQVTKKKKEE